VHRLFPAIAALVIAIPGYASLIEGVGIPSQTFDESGVKVPVFAEVTPKAADLPPTVAKLYLTGAGLREKKVTLFHVNVYIAASYIDNASALSPAAPMDGLQKSKVNALQLTFLRNLSAEQVRGAFLESLKKNGADTTNPAIQEVLQKIDMELPKGSTMTLLGVSGIGKETLWLETTKGLIHVEGPGLATQFWRIWFGEPADGGLEDLKKKLLGGKG
jgi:hypothetical protein